MAVECTKEDALFKKRLLELANTAYFKSICTYTDFLNLNEQNLFLQYKSNLPQIKTKLTGGFSSAERQMLCFYNDFCLEPVFPMAIIKIVPAHLKFCEKLTHRDYLGAILHLGIERSKIGDIIVDEAAKEAYLFVHKQIEHFILEELSKIKHTNIKCSSIQEGYFDNKIQFVEIQGTVSSLRLDAILAFAFKTSRNSLTAFITGGKVFINSRLADSNSILLQEGDIVSVRGMGKFIYKETKSKTKKGRYSITVLKYV